MIGQIFGRLTVIGHAGKDRKRQLRWACLCVCGAEKVTTGYLLRSGQAKSCGCLQRETVRNRNASHGLSGERLYNVWANMKARCGDHSNADYGGRGITVCAEWQTFEPFAEWASANGYQAALTIDRIDNDQGYSPSNCRWATPLDQSRNKRPRRDQKLSDRQVSQIRSDTRIHREIAADYGVRQQHVSRIKSGARRAFPTERTAP